MKTLLSPLLSLLLIIPLSASASVKSPTITGITHASSASLLYTITGTGFAKGAKLLIGGSAPVSTWQGGTTFIVFQPPKGKTGTVDVQVTNPDGGKVVKKGGFTYPSSAIVPVIRGVAPNQNSTTLKTVWGSNFEKGAKVYVNGVLAPSQWQVGTQYIVFQPPQGTPSGTNTVKVSNPSGGSASLSGNLTITTTVAYTYQTPATYAYQTPAAYPTPVGSPPPSDSIFPGLNHPYPRILGNFTGFQQVPDASARAQAAKFNIVVIGGNYTGFYPNPEGMTRQQSYDDIKARSVANGTDTKIVQYNDWNEELLSGWHFQTWGNIVTAANWWVYQSGTSGAKSHSGWDYPNYGLINITRFGGQYQGLYPYQMAAKVSEDIYIHGAEGAAHVATSIDYFNVDNVFWYPRGYDEPKDYSRTGNPANSSLDDFRLGQSDYFNYGRTIDPSRGWGGNADLPYDEFGNVHLENYTHLVNSMDWALMENAIGPNSTETYDGTLRFLARYKLAIEKLLTGPDRPYWIDCRDMPTSGDLSRARYAQAVTAMGPGYFGTDTSSGNIATQIYDEMYGGTINHAGWLGSATEGFQTSPRIGGTVLYRDFSNGRVWLNVRGSSPVTIDMTGFQRLNHNESLVGDAAINNGATGGTYSLAGGDAIFALRAQ